MIVLTLLPLPKVVADEVELSDEELEDYFVFEEGTWWDYMNTVSYAGDYDTSEIDFVEDEEDAISRTESLYCKVYRCFSLSTSSYYIESYIEDGNIYMDTISGYDVGDVLTFSLDGIENQELEEVQGYLLGYDSLSGIASERNCDVELGTYTYESYTGEALQHLCSTVLVGSDDVEVRMVTIESIVKDLGTVASEIQIYSDGDWQVTYSSTLVDTSVDVEDLSEEVDLAEEYDWSGIDLADYMEFENADWWEYKSTLSIYSLSSVLEGRMVQYQEDEEGLSGYLEDNKYYVNAFDGDPLEEDYLIMDLEGYTTKVQDEDIHAFGLDEETWGEMEDLVISCEYSWLESEEFTLESGKDYEGEGILEQCSFILESITSGLTMELITETTYMKDYGVSYGIARFYADGVLIIQGEQELLNSSLVTKSIFNDLEVLHKNFAAIHFLKNEGVLSGYEDGSFKPDNTVNRAELLKILVEGQGVTPDEQQYQNCFPDVTTEWYAKYVCYAKEEGWVSGYPDGTFRPADAVNKVEALKMLLNSQDIDTDEELESAFTDVSDSDWFAEYVKTAEELGLLEENDRFFFPDAERTRAGIAEELYRLLNQISEVES